jgi:hypothetical protein
MTSCPASRRNSRYPVRVASSSSTIKIFAMSAS